MQIGDHPIFIGVPTTWREERWQRFGLRRSMDNIDPWKEVLSEREIEKIAMRERIVEEKISLDIEFGSPEDDPIFYQALAEHHNKYGKLKGQGYATDRRDR